MDARVRTQIYNVIAVLFVLTLINCNNAATNFSELGCNTNPISVTHFLDNAGYETTCYPGVNCNPTNETIIRTVALYDTIEGSVICYQVNNDTEYNGTGHVNANYPSLSRIEIVSNKLLYPVIHIYSGAVNINFETNCLCSCPGSPSRLKCYDGFDYCSGNNYCQNYYFTGIYSDCIENNIGFLSSDSHACCAFKFSNHESATFFKIGSKVTSLLRADVDFYVKNSTTGNLFVQNSPPFDLLTYPNTYQTAVSRQNLNPQDIFNTVGWYAPQLAWNISWVGQFEGTSYPGNEMFAIYNGQVWYVPDANDITDYNPTKCGWIKNYIDGHGNQRYSFDAIQIKNRATVKVKSCVDDKFNITSDINPCLTNKWILASEYLAKWGGIYIPTNATEISNILTEGYISISATKAGDSLITLTGTQNFYSISYTYGVSTFTCTSTSNFQSANLTCTVLYTEGASYVLYTVYDRFGNITQQGNVVVDGSGSSLVNIVISASKFQNVDLLCLNSVDNIKRCQNITVQGYDLNVTNPSWTVKVDTNGTKPSRSEESIDFDFFDFDTWADNIWQTVIGWIIVFLIFIAVVGGIVLFIMFLPNIMNLYHRLRINGIRNKNINYDQIGLTQESELKDM